MNVIDIRTRRPIGAFTPTWDIVDLRHSPTVHVSATLPEAMGATLRPLAERLRAASLAQGEAGNVIDFTSGKPRLAQGLWLPSVFFDDGADVDPRPGVWVLEVQLLRHHARELVNALERLGCVERDDEELAG